MALPNKKRLMSRIKALLSNDLEVNKRGSVENNVLMRWVRDLPERIQRHATNGKFHPTITATACHPEGETTVTMTKDLDDNDRRTTEGITATVRLQELHAGSSLRLNYLKERCGMSLQCRMEIKRTPSKPSRRPNTRNGRFRQLPVFTLSSESVQWTSGKSRRKLR